MRVLGEQINFFGGLSRTVKAYWPLLLIVLVTGFFDGLTTVLFMVQKGVEHERNLVIYSLVGALGIYPGVILGKVAQVIAVLLLCGFVNRLAWILIVLAIALNGLAIVLNTAFILS